MLPLSDTLLIGYSNGKANTPAGDELYNSWCAEANVSRSHVSSVVNRIRRLDFSIATRKMRGTLMPQLGIRSHGAVSLAKVLEVAESIEEIRLNNNKIGAYGAACIGRALSRPNHGLKVLLMRGCYIGERGARGSLVCHLFGC